jgi:hypothetical protein
VSSKTALSSLFLFVVACASAPNSRTASDDSGRITPSTCDSRSRLPWPLAEPTDSTIRHARAIDVYETTTDASIVYLEKDEPDGTTSWQQQVRCAPGVSGPCFHGVATTRYRSKVVAYEAATARELWRVDLHDKGRWGVAGPWLVDATSADVRVYDATTGALARTIDAIAGDVCVAHDGTAWIDDRVGLAPETGALRARGDDDPCPRGVKQAVVADMTTCAAAETGIDDRMRYQTMAALANGSETAALVSVSGLHMMAILDPREHRMRTWTPLALEHPEQSTSWGTIDLAYGRVIAVYGDWLDHQRLTAFDASTGKRLWDVPTPTWPSFAITRTRVYVTGGDRGYRVYDPATGNVLFG